MRIVVTGGAGFIGSNFIRHMRSAHPEHKILCLDKLTYAGNLDNLEGILGSPNFIFSKTDIADEKAVNEALKSFMPDVIVNFAAESHVDRSIADASDFVRTNVEGVRVLLEAARMTGARFHQISTDEVYGDLPVRSTEKFTETSALRPRKVYRNERAPTFVAVFGNESRGGSARAFLSQDVRLIRDGVAIFQQLRNAPISRKAHSARREKHTWR